MKLNRIKLTTPLLIPAAIAPVCLSSCSVFTDLMKEYKPSYEQLSATLTFDQAIQRWMEKANSYSNFIKEEYFWACNQVSGETFEHKISEEYDYYYKGKFTVFSANVSYAKVANKDQNRISYKINCEIEERNEYYLQKEYYGYGTVHYSCEWECQNLAFDITKEYNEELKKNFWLIKPVKYDAVANEWTDYLNGDELISFNLRWICETYDKEGIQTYGFEATEAAVMDKQLSYTTQLGKILNYFCCFYSYYLDDCKFA